MSHARVTTAAIVDQDSVRAAFKKALPARAWLSLSGRSRLYLLLPPLAWATLVGYPSQSTSGKPFHMAFHWTLPSSLANQAFFFMVVPSAVFLLYCTRRGKRRWHGARVVDVVGGAASLVAFFVGVAWNEMSSPGSPAVAPGAGGWIVLIVVSGLIAVVGILYLALGRHLLSSREQVGAAICVLVAFVGLAAGVDWGAAQANHQMFSVNTDGGAVLTKVAAGYFAVTTFTTLGLGDVRPHIDTARVLVAGQSAIGFGLVGVGLALVLTRTKYPSRRARIDEHLLAGRSLRALVAASTAGGTTMESFDEVWERFSWLQQRHPSTEPINEEDYWGWLKRFPMGLDRGGPSTDVSAAPKVDSAAGVSAPPVGPEVSSSHDSDHAEAAPDAPSSTPESTE